MPNNEKNVVAVFWDYENCPVPTHCETFEAIQHVVKMAEGFGNLTTLRAYTEPCKISSRSSLRSALNLYHGQLISCPHHGKTDVVDKRLLVDMLTFAMDNPSPSTIILISVDGDFKYAVEQLQERGHEMVIIAAINRQMALCQAASRAFDWRTVLGSSDSEPELVTDSGDEEQSSDSISSEEDWDDTSWPSRKESVGNSTTLSPNRSAANSSCTGSNFRIGQQSAVLTFEEISTLLGHLDVSSDDLFHVPTSYRPLIEYLAKQEAKGIATPRRSTAGSALTSGKAVHEEAGFPKFRGYIAHAQELGLVELGGEGDTAWVRLNSDWVKGELKDKSD